MKRLFILIALILMLSGLTAAQRKLNAQKTSPAETLIGYEKQTWKLVKQKNLQSFADFIAEDFYGIYPDSESVTKSQLLDSLRAFDLKDYRLTNFRVTILNKEAAIISYRAESQSLDKGRNVIAYAALVSGWAKRRGRWKIVFYREIALS